MTRSSVRMLRRSAPVAAGLLSAVLLAAEPAASAATALHVVPSPNPAGGAPGSADLVSAAAVSPADAWAVGYFNASTTGFLGAPLAEHFDGTQWSITPTPAVPASDDVRFAGVAFSSASDGWGVGADLNVTTGNGTSLIEHFNSTSWTRLPSPTGEPFRAGLVSVAAVSATNAWAVGSGGNTPLIEHFDGTAWHRIAQPVNTYDSFLISVSAASPSDIWAVGGQSGGTSAPVLLEHFDGTAWTEVPNPTLPANLTYYGWLRGVAAIGPGDIWVVGSAVANSLTRQTLALHFDGTSWQVVPSDNPPAASGILESVAGTIPGQPLWATGPGTTIETTTG